MKNQLTNQLTKKKHSRSEEKARMIQTRVCIIRKLPKKDKTRTKQ